MAEWNAGSPIRDGSHRPRCVARGVATPNCPIMLAFGVAIARTPHDNRGSRGTPHNGIAPSSTERCFTKKTQECFVALVWGERRHVQAQVVFDRGDHGREGATDE